MKAGYYWPDTQAVVAINALLSLPATGREQDWELELSDPDRLDEMLDLLDRGDLGLEERSALALLAMFSLESAAELNYSRRRYLTRRVRQVLLRDRVVHVRMRSYWRRRHRIAAIKAVVARP